MVTRRTTRPLANFLLRVAQEEDETVGMRYELVDLRGGGVRRFTSMRSLAQYVDALQRSAARPSAARSSAMAPKRARKRA
jgi:hypothetical protein